MAAKGYWLKQAKIESTAQFIEYVKTVVPWLRSVGGTIIAKDVNQNSDLNEWDGGQLGVIVEFESKDAAQKAFNSSEFQEVISLEALLKKIPENMQSRALRYRFPQLPHQICPRLFLFYCLKYFHNY